MQCVVLMKPASTGMLKNIKIEKKNYMKQAIIFYRLL